MLSSEAVTRYRRDGFYFPIRVLSPEEARGYRARLEAVERANRGPLGGRLRQKSHLLFTWLNELIRHPRILDAVEDLLGPDLLCWSSSFFIKEARDPAFVSWHQDSTYWGLSEPDVVTAWVARQPALARPGDHGGGGRGPGGGHRVASGGDVAAPRAHVPRLPTQPLRRPSHRLRHPLHPAADQAGRGDARQRHPGARREILYRGTTAERFR
jgi:hypothetical protein